MGTSTGAPRGTTGGDVSEQESPASQVMGDGGREEGSCERVA